MTPTRRLPDPDAVPIPPSSPLGDGEGKGEVARADRELLERLRAGDAAAFEAIFRGHYNALCLFARNYVQSAHVAEELVEDVFCWVWEHRSEWRVDRGVKAYLYGAVRNRAFKHMARYRMSVRIEEEADREDRVLAMGQAQPATDHRIATEEFADAVARAVESLPPRCRQAYVLHRQHELSYLEIADVMGTSVKTVENQIARALKALRMSLAAWKP